MSSIHRPERKIAVGVRFTASEHAWLKARARAEDRSLNSLVVRIVRERREAEEAKEMAADE
jgi:predicted HicB family RNase H-like nuclease